MFGPKSVLVNLLWMRNFLPLTPLVNLSVEADPVGHLDTGGMAGEEDGGCVDGRRGCLHYSLELTERSGKVCCAVRPGDREVISQSTLLFVFPN